MQKKIIALAVAGLVSGAAFAQSNVTVFGIVDVGYQYSWGSTQDNQKNSMSQIKAGGQDGSRFGLRGTEDLGNGLKANFEMAAGFDADVGASYGGRLMSEGAFVGLSGDKWGAVKAGYFASFIDDNTGIDVTGRIGVSSTGMMGTGKYQNFVAYITPNWSGFQGKLGYSSNTNAQDQIPLAYSPIVGLNLNVRAYTGMVAYDNGKLKLGAVYAAYQPQNVSTTTGAVQPETTNGSEWNIGAAYDFGMVALSAYYQKQENAKGVGYANGPALDIDNRDFWAIGVKVPLGAKDSIRLGYGEINNTYYNRALDDDNGHAFTLTYLHDLSKRTNFYALYGNISADGLGATNVPAYSNGGYDNAFNVGIRHLF